MKKCADDTDKPDKIALAKYNPNIETILVSIICNKYRIGASQNSESATFLVEITNLKHILTFLVTLALFHPRLVSFITTITSTNWHYLNSKVRHTH